MKFKKITALFMAAAVFGMAGLTACSSQSGGQDSSSAGQSSQEDASTESGDLLAQIQERGEIVIAMEGTWAPWTYHDENDELVGFDVEVGQQIAEALGVEATFVEGEWDGLLAGLDAGRYDIMINGVDVTEERSDAYDFSDPYAYNRTAVIVSGDNTDIASMAVSYTHLDVYKRQASDRLTSSSANRSFILITQIKIPQVA